MPQRNLSQISFFAPGRLVLYVQCRSEALQRQFSEQTWASFSSCFLYLLNSLCVSERFLTVTLPCLQPLVSYLALSVKPHGEESVVYSGFVFWLIMPSQFSSVQFSHSVMSDSLQPHESQHARPPCPSPTPGVYSNPCPSSWWCHPTISSSIVPFSSCPHSLPASGLFPVNSAHEVAKVLEFQFQHQSFQWISRTDLL